MEENSFSSENMTVEERMECMQREIEELKAALASKDPSPQKAVDMSKIKCMFDEGFSKIVEALRPVLDSANQKISEPAKAAATKLEEKIAVNPFTAVMMALGVGFLLGKTIDIISSRNSYYDED